MNTDAISRRITFTLNDLGDFVKVRNAAGDDVLGGVIHGDELALFFDFGSDCATPAGVSALVGKTVNFDALRVELASKIAASDIAHLIDDSFPAPAPAVDDDADDFYQYN